MVSSEILRIIEEEAGKSVLCTMEEDPWTAELDREYEFDYKMAQCLILDWLNNSFPINKVLYAGSGFDIFPKIILGEEKVVHTSLENYSLDKIRYFPELGDGAKVVADNNNLPFGNSSFDMVLFFGLFTRTIERQLIESKRVLTHGGLIVCDNLISDNIDLSEIFPDYTKINVPVDFQSRGVSETSFSVFKKLR